MGQKELNWEKVRPFFTGFFRDPHGILTPAIGLLFRAARASQELLKTDNHMYPPKSRVLVLFGLRITIRTIRTMGLHEKL
jgi:hypothetical protein